MDDNDLQGLLGDFYDELDDEQRRQIIRADQAIAERWPHPDLAEQRQVALNSVLAMVYGDSPDEDSDAAREYLAIRAAEVAAQARLTGAIIAGTILAPEESESARAARLGVSRQTVRKALGKKPRRK